MSTLRFQIVGGIVISLFVLLAGILIGRNTVSPIPTGLGYVEACQPNAGGGHFSLVNVKGKDGRIEITARPGESIEVLTLQSSNLNGFNYRGLGHGNNLPFNWHEISGGITPNHSASQRLVIYPNAAPGTYDATGTIKSLEDGQSICVPMQVTIKG